MPRTAAEQLILRAVTQESKMIPGTSILKLIMRLLLINRLELLMVLLLLLLLLLLLKMVALFLLLLLLMVLLLLLLLLKCLLPIGRGSYLERVIFPLQNIVN